MTTNKTATEFPACENAQKPSALKISKIGIVSRDYKKTESFGDSLPAVLRRLDEEGCDAVLFSLFGLEPEYDTHAALEGLENINAVFVETFVKKPKRDGKDFFVYYRTSSGWEKYQLNQKFATDKHPEKVHEFVKDELPNRRCFGNSCVLLCGESNGVKYNTKDVEKIDQLFKLRKAILEEVRIILNPCHDYMSLPVMKKKRAFLSENGRWVISVWCKGKTLENGTRRDAKGPAWTIYHDGEKQNVGEIKHDCGADVYIGILDVGSDSSHTLHSR